MMEAGALHDRIAALEERRRLAMLAGDIALLRDLCSEALVYTHSRGEQDRGHAYLDKVAHGFFNYHALDFRIDEVADLGDGAAVAGTMTGEVDAGTERRQLHARYLAVWAREVAGWRLRFYQPTPIVNG